MNKSLLYRYLSDELSDNEYQELLDWVNASEANRQLFSELKNTWAIAGSKGQMTESDLQKEYEQFLTRRNLLSDSLSLAGPVNRKFAIGYYLLRIAAVLLIIYGTGITYLYLYNTDNQEFYDIYTRKGEKSQLVLSDGTKIWINSDSHLRYPTKMDKRKVVVQLDGEAYFDVAKLKNRMFIVRASELDITALGTSFNVKSYKEEGTVETTLEEGKIQITGEIGTEKLHKPLIILPNQRVTIFTNPEALDRSSVKQTLPEIDNAEDHEEIQIEKIDSDEIVVQKQANTSIYTSWKDGKLQFRKQRFEELALLLERWYDIAIEINDEEIKDWRYTGTFDKETIEQALNALSMSMPFSYTINKNVVTIDK